MTAGFAVAACLTVGTARDSHAEPILNATILSGIDQDATAIGRLFAGGLWGLGNFAPEAHISFEGFIRLGDTGVKARSFTLLDVGARYGFKNSRFHGPYVVGGGSFGIFTGKPHERRVDDADTCMTAGTTDKCTYRIDKNVSAHLGFGWGFSSGKKTTVGVRLDLTYWMFSLNNGEDQPLGSPNPNDVGRPQAAWSMLVGLEFLRWR